MICIVYVRFKCDLCKKSLPKMRRQITHFFRAYACLLFAYAQEKTDICMIYDDMFKEQSIKYLGSQISAPGINEPSNISALDFKPIIEVYETNPNQLIYAKEPKPVDGTNRILPGNIIVR